MTKLFTLFFATIVMFSTNAHAFNWNLPHYKPYIIVKYERGQPPQRLEHLIFRSHDLCLTNAILMSGRTSNNVIFVCETR